MTTTTREQLALLACEGLSDAELKERGTKGFKAMIERKRKYAAASRAMLINIAEMTKVCMARDKRIAELEAKQAELTAKLEAAMGLDAPVEDVTQVGATLASIFKGAAK